ncbi:esterase family protein [Antrihabitans sp. YC3-6]|uniref:Esterase family protein n=1 Tax=Antrihabitans stalagmiti TaxID=2799499 RepID=A0A934NMK8_9NOCA|nr:alpha/beta hydrolase family protein [Antrihabitans stalagmiti]MBJ8337986.1 esterase family protein [Antrihabitans stalagmiti]
MFDFRKSARRLTAATIVTSALAATAFATAAPAVAEPGAEPASLEQTEVLSDRRLNLYVYSGAMDRMIKVQVIKPADTSAPRPVLYLLNGAGGGMDGANWDSQTDLDGFFADKNVNVVIPNGGAFSYYTDWQQPDPVLGRPMWTTFLTQELPPIVDAALGTTGVNAIAGVSMAGSSALALAQAAPDLYRAVGAYSGCAETSTPIGRQFVRLVVEGRGRANTANMWGPGDDPAWAAADPFVNAEKLRGKHLYISSGTGLPGIHETLENERLKDNPMMLANQAVTGGIIEAATFGCTQHLAMRLGELQIPATFDFRPTGTHSWGYWEDDLHNSWPGFATAIGL